VRRCNHLKANDISGVCSKFFKKCQKLKYISDMRNAANSLTKQVLSYVERAERATEDRPSLLDRRSTTPTGPRSLPAGSRLRPPARAKWLGIIGWLGFEGENSFPRPLAAALVRATESKRGSREARTSSPREASNRFDPSECADPEGGKVRHRRRIQFPNALASDATVDYPTRGISDNWELWIPLRAR
jgi:hypothetical protein